MLQEAPTDRAAHSQLQAETFNGKADFLSKPLPREVEEVQAVKLSPRHASSERLVHCASYVTLM